MAHKVSWLIEKRIILVENSGMMTLEDLQEVDKQVRAFIEQGYAPMYILSDIRYLDKAPFSFSAMRQSMEGASNPKIAWIVEINSSNPVIRRITALLARVMGIRFIQVATMEEAIEHLQEQDTTIDWESWQENA